MQFDKTFVINTLSEKSVLYDHVPTLPSFSVDSRICQPGDIFVALQGATCDGHDFVADAFKKGAAGVIVAEHKKDVLSACDQKQLQASLVLVVPDTLKALFLLARAWRQQVTYPIIAITGSLGKTSTKEYISHILNEHALAHIASEGNQNTLLGVALNMLKLRKEHRGGVFEVGISQRGEMKAIVDLLRPTNGVITCIGHQHMDGLGTLHDIAHEKRSLFSFFTERDIGIVFGDQPSLAAVSYPHPIVKFGSKTTNQIQARKIKTVGDEVHFTLKIYRKKFSMVLKHTHEGSVFNALAATAVAHLLHVPDDVIVAALQKPLSVKGRFESCALKENKGTLINDCYNANPESVKAALVALHNIQTGSQKVAVLGDMLGLGETAPFWHRQIGRFLRKVSSLDKLILVGESVAWVKKTAPVGLDVELVSSWEHSVPLLDKTLQKKAIVLVKGSQDTGLSNVVRTFVDELESQ